ncbi:retrovirus-related Pol polyprotein from transposon 17.6 [Trichonephila clavipes]|nr:retrovirus-related Pol polyprotein from transposon 17.6 [Trichonephila clavipes]
MCIQTAWVLLPVPRKIWPISARSLLSPSKSIVNYFLTSIMCSQHWIYRRRGRRRRGRISTHRTKAANSDYLSRTEKPDVNSLWIVEQTSRSSLDKNEGECQASQYKLYAVGKIPTYGLKILTLDLGLRRPFQWPFIIAKVERGIIGADFLQKFQLLIDLHNRKINRWKQIFQLKNCFQENNDLSTVNRASKFQPA